MSERGVSAPSGGRSGGRASPSRTSPGFSVQRLAGRYAHHFTGNTMQLNIRYSLYGVGHLEIARDGTVSGRQRASITPLQGQRAGLKTGSYSLSGKVVKLDRDGSGDATISFTSTDGKGRNVDGTFFVQVAGTADRLWFVSSGATLPKSGGAEADEQVTVEAVRLRD